MLTLTQRLTLAAVIAAILIGPAVMLLAALSAHGHRTVPPPQPTVVHVINA